MIQSKDQSLYRLHVNQREGFDEFAHFIVQQHATARSTTATSAEPSSATTNAQPTTTTTTTTISYTASYTTAATVATTSNPNNNLTNVKAEAIKSVDLKTALILG